MKDAFVSLVALFISKLQEQEEMIETLRDTMEAQRESIEYYEGRDMNTSSSEVIQDLKSEIQFWKNESQFWKDKSTLAQTQLYEAQKAKEQGEDPARPPAPKTDEEALKRALDFVDSDMFLKHVKDNEKIQAIKMIRHITYWGLKESKDFVDDHFQRSGCSLRSVVRA